MRITNERLERIAEIFNNGAKHARDKAARRKRMSDEQLDIEVATYHAEAVECIRAVLAVRELCTEQEAYTSGARDGDSACRARVDVAGRLRAIVGAAEGDR